jgi:hypothetical protein
MKLDFAGKYESQLWQGVGSSLQLLLGTGLRYFCHEQFNAVLSRFTS